MDNETLVALIRQDQDVKTNMEQLYLQNKGMIYKLIKRYRNIDRMVDLDDLMQEAYFGLWEAVQRYEPDQGASFMSYAGFWIKQAVRRYLDQSGRLISLPVRMQERIYKYNKVTGSYLSQYDREPTDQEYCYWMDCTQKQLDSIRRTMHITDSCSIETPVDDKRAIGDTLTAEMPEYEASEDAIDNQLLKEELWSVVGSILDKDDTAIIKDRVCNGFSVKECGARRGIDTRAVRNRENKAMRKLRSNRHIAEIGEREGIFAPVRRSRRRVDYTNEISWYADLTDEELLVLGAVL